MTEKLRYNPSPDDAVFNSELEHLLEIVERTVPGKGKLLILEIADEFGGTHVAFPKRDHFTRHHRDDWIRARYDEGFKVPQIARAVGLGERRVWDILGKAPSEDRQLNLFDK